MSLLRTAATKQAAGVLARSAALRAVAGAACSSVSGAARSFSRSAVLSAPSKKVKVWRVDNPYTGEIISEVPQLTGPQAAALVLQAEAAYKGFKGTTLEQRIQLVNKSLHTAAQ